jgi:organic radical activating enzyme
MSAERAPRPREARVPLFDGPEPWLRAGSTGAPALARAEEIEDALARAAGSVRVVLVGDRAGLHPEIEELVRRARVGGGASGAEEVVVEAPPFAFTGGADPEALARAGATSALAVVGGIRRRVFEHALAAPGTFDASMHALAALSASPLALEVLFPLWATTADDAVPFVEWLLASELAVTEIHLAIPPAAAVSTEGRALLLPFSAQADVAARVFEIARRAGIRYGFADRRAPSPCAGVEALDPYGFVFHERVRHLQRHDPGELTRVGACAACSLGAACPGIERAYVARFGEDELSPVPLDRSLAWRLRRTDQVAQDYRHVSPFSNAADSSGRSLVRVNGHCQMACSFCFVDRTVPDFDAKELEAAFDALATRHADHLVLSGGEPTLHPELPALIAHAKSLGFRTIEIQTNGVRAADRAYAESLVRAGLNKVTVSLHSKDPETSDAITKMKGAFPKTVEALHAFRALGVETQIAHVLTKANYRELPGFVRWLTETFPPREAHLSMCLALAQGISDLVYSWAIPRFDEVKPYVKDALDHCLDAGLGFGGLVGQGGYPPCMLDGDLRYYERVLAHLYVSDDHDAQFHKAERCAECSFDPWCVGIRNDYVRTYGDGEIRPFTADVSALSAAAPLVSPDRLVRARGADRSTDAR